jgi:hypothetical protein
MLKAAPIGHMLERCALLAGQDQPALFGARQALPSRSLSLDAMPFPLRHQLCDALLQAAVRPRSSRAM